MAPFATLLVAGGWLDWEDDLTAAAREALETASFGRDERHLRAPPELGGVHQVNTSADDDPIYVPKVDVELGDAGAGATADASAAPDSSSDASRAPDAAYRIAAEIVRALQPALADERVRHYDVVFTVGETGFWETADQRRIAVTPDLAERLDREPSFDAATLRDEIEAADDGDHELPPVAWGEPLGYQYYHGSSDWSGSAAFLGM